MTTTRAKIGFIGSSAPSSPHHESFKAFIPLDIDITFVQEAEATGSLYDSRGKVDLLIRQASELKEMNQWDGVIISGGPREALNPGLWERLSGGLKIPVATALRSSAAALKVLPAKRVLLMTPVDDQLKAMYRSFLADFEIETVYPPQTLRSHTDAQKLSPGDVETMTKKSLLEQSPVDAIYFQGALLDPLPILEKMETELKVPIIASNPAMLWFLLSTLGFSYRIPGYGRLLSSWPPLPNGF
jgi:hypothetical protein